MSKRVGIPWEFPIFLPPPKRGAIVGQRGQRNKKFAFWATAEEREDIKWLAEKLGRSQSNAVRWVIRQAVEAARKEQ